MYTHTRRGGIPASFLEPLGRFVETFGNQLGEGFVRAKKSHKACSKHLQPPERSCADARMILHERRFMLKSFLQSNLPHIMFCSSNIEGFV